MINIYSSAPPQTPLSLSLRRIWRVEADRSYDTRPADSGAGDWRIIRTLSGGGDIRLHNGEQWAPGSASVAIVRLGEIQRYRCLGDHWHFWWFECGIDFPENAVPRRSPFPAPVTSEESALREQIWRNLLHPARESHRVASAGLAFLLHHWLAASAPTNDPAERIGRILAEIPLRLSERWQVSEMAWEAGMSERALRYAFKRFTGLSPNRYLRDVRLRVAAELLITTELQVGEIADQLAFSSAFHFSKAFRTAYGEPPSEYRKSHAGIA